ncbi:MAG: serine/threonine protein kinase, partial [Planctomycetia bacterium]
MNAAAAAPPGASEQNEARATREPTMEFTYKSGARPLDGYTIKRGLGRGGFGEVYYALSDGGREVALKAVLRHLDVELRGVAQCLNLKHPNLLSIFDVRRTDQGEAWLIMEFVAGPSLRDRLDQVGGPLPIEETLEWLEGVAAAVDYLHRHGIVHRDLKPANVFREEGLVKVGDYSLSKFLSVSHRSGQTQSVGTVHYMAPEISTGNYGKSIDDYSLAIMAYEMSTGAMPFDGETAGEMLMKHLTAEPDLSKAPAAWRPVFHKALAKNPTDRFGSAGEMMAAFRAAAGLGGNAAPAGYAGPVGQGSPVVDGPTPSAQSPIAPSPPPNGRPAPHAAFAASLPPLPGTFAAGRRTAGDLLRSMFLGGLLAGVLPVLALAGEVVLTEREPNLTRFAALVVSTAASTWGVLLLGGWWDAHRTERWLRRIQALLFGAVMGGVLTGVQFGLLQPSADAALLLTSAGVEAPGFQVASVEALLPHLLKLVGLCGLIYLVPDWAQSVSRLRMERYSTWRTLWPAVVALALANWIPWRGRPASVFLFDEVWLTGLLLLTALIVQWVRPNDLRPRRLLGGEDVYR